MTDTIEDFAPPSPTGLRPLLGLTVLVVEDSRFACEALRLMCLRSGARIRRADCLRSARRHLEVYRPSVVVVDVGLPDGSGVELIDDLNVARPRVEVILAASGDAASRAISLAAGADDFIAKPITSLALFQDTVLRHLPPERQPNGPRAVPNDRIVPDRMAFRDDMAHIADVMSDGASDAVMDYLAQFISGVAESAADTHLADAARALARARETGQPTQTSLARLAALVQDRLRERQVI